MALCEAPRSKPTKFVRDITDNLIDARTAWGLCAARMKCLVGWINAAAGKPDAVCTRASSGLYAPLRVTNNLPDKEKARQVVDLVGFNWWAILGSNQWPMPCEGLMFGVGSLSTYSYTNGFRASRFLSVGHRRTFHAPRCALRPVARAIERNGITPLCS